MKDPFEYVPHNVRLANFVATYAQTDISYRELFQELFPEERDLATPRSALAGLEQSFMMS